MNIFFYACNAFEPWDFRNPDTVGIGGSETAQIELAQRLAKRGHNVVSYAPIADDCPEAHDGVKWLHYKNADLTQPGLWIIFRSPGAADKFNLPIDVPNHENIAFDWGGSLECNEELRQMARYAYAAGKGVHIIAAAGEKEVPPNEQYEKMLKEANVPYTSINVVLFGKGWEEAATRKVEKMKELGCTVIYDDQPAILDAVKEAGLCAWLSYSTDKDLKEIRGQTLWMVAQDVVYWDGAGGAYRPERTNKLSKILALCPVHMDYLKTSFPFMADRVFLSSNGIKTNAIDEKFPVDNMPNRDPYRLIWMSSPDRGLEALLHIFNRAKEYEPKLNLHIYYGFDNWDKVIGGEQKKTKKAISQETLVIEELKDVDLSEFKFGKPSCIQETMKKTIVDLSKQGGVYFHGRTNQPDLWKEITKSGIWCYSSTFTETSPVHGDTLVETLNGQVKIKDLVGKEFKVYSCDATGRISISDAKDCRCTRQNEPVIKLTYRPGRGRNAKQEKTLTLTPDHEVMLKDGTYIAAGNLKIGDRVKAFQHQPGGFGNGYATIGLTDGKMVPAHRLVATKMLGRELLRGEVVDHIDGDTTNNLFDNLQVHESQSKHIIDHWERNYEEKSSNITKGTLKFNASLTPEELSEIKSRGPKALWEKMNADPAAKKEFSLARAAKTPEEKERWFQSMEEVRKKLYGHNPWWNYDTLYQMYIVEEKSTTQIGEELGTHNGTIGYWLKKHGIPVRSCGQKTKNKASNHIIMSSKPAGTADVYCMEVTPDHNFIANGIVVHNCIACMENQALGAIPVTNNLWALDANIANGIIIEGDPMADMLVRLRYVHAIVNLANNPQMQEAIRQKSMPWARKYFDWERFVSEYETWIGELNAI